MLLYFFLIIPFLGSFLSFFSQKFGYNKPRLCAILTLFVNFLTLLFIYYKYFFSINLLIFPKIYWNLEYFTPWIQSLGISFHLALDNFSFLMIFFTLILGLCSVLLTWNNLEKNIGIFYCGLMSLIGSLIGVFLSVDLFLFFLFWELTIFLTYFLLIFYGNNKYSKKNRIFYANKFLIYSQISGFFLLISILGLSINYFIYKHLWTFDYNVLKNFNYNNFNNFNFYFLMFGFIFSFLIKIPIVPFHSWLIDFYKISPVSGSLDILGTLIKTSFYGIFRFNIVFFPELLQKFSIIFIIISIFSMFYSSFLAMKSNNAKKILAYGSISHMSLMFLSLYIGNFLSYQGVLLQIFASSITFSALFIILGKIFNKFKKFNFLNISGLWKKIKYLPEFFIFFTISNVGLPSTGNFLGEFLILLGIYNNSWKILILVLCNLLFSFFYYLRVFHNICYGKKNIFFKKINIYKKDFFMLLFFSILLIILGLFPKIFLFNIFNII
ncbi:NADH-quinone oxidoreductase subunit M [Buchnera aphidicola]|uniref:complex I subunit 4 family protein n=1 Tax=Buchnera aphidicola TaxID=9 RepID=UPI0030EF98A4